MTHEEKQTEIPARILEAAFTLFRQYGIRAITMDEIASRTGMSKKTLYLQFADKDELVTICIERRIEQIREHSLSVQQQAKDAVEELFLTMQYIEGLFRNMNPTILMDMQKFHPAAFGIYKQYMNEFVIQLIRANIIRGKAEKVYRENIDLEIISRFRLESCMLCFRTDIFPKDLFEMSRVQRELMEHFVYGITTKQGQELILKYKQQHLKEK